jgi:xanthine dehydrogenase YagT iron-sulfur-binding subunit
MVRCVPDAVRVPLSLRINGAERSVVVDTRISLLDLLRERLGLTGAKKGCDHGQCGACTILIDGRRANACLALAVAHQGAEILTVEGLVENGELGRLARAFVEHDAFQCGYCTSGQLCSAIGMLGEVDDGWPSAVTDNRDGSGIQVCPEEIRERMSGNICRCAAYPGIVAAIAEAGS